jgi:micrococcal nuclease
MSRRHFSRALLALLILVMISAGMALVRVIQTAGEPNTVAALLVERVVDGDTLVVIMPSGEKERVRLIGVDTPEFARDGRPEQFFAREATACARRLVTGARVTLEPDLFCSDRDDYGRLLRYVWLPDGRLMNDELISSGCGKAFTRFRFSLMEQFKASERRARGQGLGIWSGRGAEGEI